jgi:hypothetical protein
MRRGWFYDPRSVLSECAMFMEFAVDRDLGLDLHEARLTVAAMPMSAVAAPSLNVLGSYFPTWILCALCALAATVLVRRLFIRTGVDRSLPAPLLVYLAITLAVSFGGWLLWLS